jgi:hypothetical protein
MGFIGLDEELWRLVVLFGMYSVPLLIVVAQLDQFVLGFSRRFSTRCTSLTKGQQEHREHRQSLNRKCQPRPQETGM